MSISKKIARQLVFPIMNKTGIINLIAANSSHSIVNLLYHGVVKTDSSGFSPTHTLAEEFERHIQYYKRHFDIISIADAFDHYRNGKKVNRKTITLSFDDGFKNNLENALPILEKYDVKATFFICGICTQPMEVRSLWTEYFNCLNYFHRNELIEIANLKFRHAYDAENNISMSSYIKNLGKKERDQLMVYLITKYNLKDKIQRLPEEFWKLMDAEELKKFASSKVVEIGSHGYLHYNLASIKPEEAESDMANSKQALEATLQKSVTSIAYPDGSYDKTIKDLAEKCGFNDQLAVDFRTDTDQEDKRILPRYGISCTTTFDSNMLSVARAFSKYGFN